MLAATVQAQQVADLRRGLEAMEDGDWDTALSVSGKRGSLSRDIIVWHWLRAGKGSAGDTLVFLGRRPDWPGLDWLRRKSEESFAEESPKRILSYFDETPPQSAEGALIQANALIATDQSGDAQASLVLAWRTMPMKAATQAAYLEDHADLLAPHHAARLDRMLWDRNLSSARRTLPLVDEGQAALAEARIALYERGSGVDALISAVPSSLRGDPGLAHARFVWRHRKNRDKDAMDLILAQSASPDTLGEPDKWARSRRDLARWEMRNGNPNRAYQAAAEHHLTPDAGYSYADLEWIAGYLALTKLNDPTTALRHFGRFDAAVATPISKGRAGYWLGRAHAANGDAEAAHAAYAMGAEHQTSFYGLLAAERIGRPFDPALASPEPPAPWKNAEFMSSDVTLAGLMLLAAGEINLAERFLTHQAESLSASQAAQMGQMLIDMERPHLAVMVAKRVARRGDVLPGAYYPMHPLAQLDLLMAPEMNLSIARRESEFDPRVISGAGARGLMQVMPATAKLVAKEIGTTPQHSTSRLTADWEYNALLGSSYLSGLAEEFDGNVVMMSAGYNAGPRRPIRWMEIFGDPRIGPMDIVDWIEHIPFNETRNYVMRVTESLPVYRARLGQEPLPIPFSKELVGSTLKAFAPQGE